MSELINSKQIKSARLIIVRTFAILTAVMLPVILLSFESLVPLMKYSYDTGIVIDELAFMKYILWWLLPTVMTVTGLGTFLTVLTSAPIAIFVQFVWWFMDSAVTGLSGDTRFFTLMIRHNTLNGSELIQQNFYSILLNRGLLLLISFVLISLSIAVYNRKRGGKLDYDYFIQKYSGLFKKRLLARFQK